MNCLIAGASGLVGGHLLNLALSDSSVNAVTSVGRRPLGIKSDKLKEVTLDWDHEQSFQVPSADVAFCCLGTTIKKAGSQEAFRKVDHDYIVRFAKAARSAGVGHFLVVSALGANSDSSIFYNKVKGETEDDLRKIGFSSLSIFRPSLLLGERVEKRAAEALMIRLFPYYRPLLIGPLAKQMPIEAAKVAEAMLKKAKSQEPGASIVLNHEML